MKHWSDHLDANEQKNVFVCSGIARDFPEAQLPGIALMKLVDHLVKILEEYDKAFLSYVHTPVVQKVAWDEASKSWRDIMTGVCVSMEDEKHGLR